MLSFASRLVRQPSASLLLKRTFLPVPYFVQEYCRSVCMDFGIYKETKGPGIHVAFWPFQDYVVVDLRTLTYDLAPQDIITKDNVTCKVSAVLYHRVEDPVKAVFNVQDTNLALSDLRDALCERTFAEILSKRQTLGDTIKENMANIARNWGVVVEKVQMKNIDLVDVNMLRVLSKERERTAAIIRADGELQSAKKLAEAAASISKIPSGFQLRRLLTYEKISQEPTQHTVIVPFAKPTNSAQAAKLGLMGAATKDSSSGMDSVTKILTTSNEQLMDRMVKMTDNITSSNEEVKDKLSGAIDMLKYVASRR